MMTSTRRLHVRPMTLADVPPVTDIERASFPVLWPVTAYQRELQHNALARYLVACAAAPEGNDRKTILGFVGVWLMVDEGHIVTLAAAPAARRQGVASWLLLAALDLARAERQRVLTLEVRASNAAAQALYRKFGYREVGRRPRYYSDNHEDAVIMSTPDLLDPAFRAGCQRIRRALAERTGAAVVELRA